MFLARLQVLAAALDFADFEPDVLQYKIVEEDEGTEGSWEEEARAPYRVYKITKIRLTNLKDLPEFFEELKALKKGSLMRLGFRFKDDDNNFVDVESDAAPVYSIHWQDDDLTIETSLYGVWEGEKPAQSQKGRHRITIGDQW